MKIVERKLLRLVLRLGFRLLKKNDTESVCVHPEHLAKWRPEQVSKIFSALAAGACCLFAVQAVSQLRQKRLGEAAVSLNNLVSATRALPEGGPMAWTSRAELAELYRLYCDKQGDAAKQAHLQVNHTVAATPLHSGHTTIGGNEVPALPQDHLQALRLPMRT